MTVTHEPPPAVAEAPDSKVRQFRAGIARQWAGHRAGLARARMW
jgi:hypothetical protein